MARRGWGLIADQEAVFRIHDFPEELAQQGEAPWGADSMSPWVAIGLSRLGQLLSRHHRLLMTKLDALSSGDIDRLMIQMPPGSAKSTYASVYLPTWWLAQHPKDSIIAASHTVGLAAYFGRRARTFVTEEAASLGYAVSAGNRSNAQWSTTAGGEYYAVGVRGAVVGRRADLAIVDDPVRSQADVDKSTHRERLWDWYRSELLPRLKPNARLVLVTTRWHEDDLCGRLLEREPNEWACVSLPALAEDNDQLERSAGEVLWSEWENVEALSRRRNTVGERTWTAQFQQAPKPLQGSLFQVEHIDFVDEPPPSAAGSVVRAWDLAATVSDSGGNPDWTVGVKLMRHDTMRHTVLDVIRFRGSSREVEERIAATAKMDGRHVVIGLPQDPGQAGKSQISWLTAMLAGYQINSTRETGSKITRATPVISQVSGSNLAVVRASWNHLFLEELRDFPFGHKDDQVDALSRAFHMLTETSSAARSVPLTHMDR